MTMERRAHGNVGTTKAARLRTGMAEAIKRDKDAAKADATSDRFGYLFAYEADELLPVGPDTIRQLGELAETMQSDAAGDSGIPAVYTYFGQFLDHDITLDEGSGAVAVLERDDFPVIDAASLPNSRTAAAELDSVYFLGVPRDQDNKNRMRVGLVSPTGQNGKPFLRPEGKGDLNDLPRQKRDDDPNNVKEDRAAIIGDPRNDENTIIAQLHTAFLKAHNALVAKGGTFDDARDEMILRYQSIVLDDFAKRICDPGVHQDVMTNGSRWQVADATQLFMPAEFAFAAYRFGHSMVRTNYDFNLNFNTQPGGIPASLNLLFTFTALSGQLGEFDTLPENWIVEWERIAPMSSGVEPQHAHPIDPRLTSFLFQLKREDGTVLTGNLAPKLAARNLKRGYRVGLPTGQALARRLGEVPLRGDALLAALPDGAMRDKALPFVDKTPLWFYVLVEAVAHHQGRRLGRVGSRIVMDTLWNLVRWSNVSVLEGNRREEFRTTLPELLQLAALEG
ncbi:hypothetical protein ASC95_14485 [Pelomonas sp. Root1217]|uniref:peroxidase family protein n=1 Tax=Pelomonas sp. Root1217 TaxID=1736430 RepID=UPI00071456E7|nr:peroxidase family protein [Pelomonas sp. Root1217]KQV50567.1 hypothetical protein ASC95_14485 [Pelomonas sp. Root1217]